MFWGSVQGVGVRASYCSIRTLYGFFVGIDIRLYAVIEQAV